MKKTLIILMLLASTGLVAQSSFGVKGGLNFSDNGKIEFSDLDQVGETIQNQDTDRKVGYHFGVYYRLELPLGFFIRPELLYTETKSSIKYNNLSSDYDVSKLDLPILAGVKIFGPLNVFVGPSLQYILKNDFENLEIKDVENNFTVGAQFGLGVQLGSLGVDVRYERALTESQAEFMNLDNSAGAQRIDGRPDQFLVSLSLDL